MDIRLAFALFLIGLAAIIGQIILIRELLVIFHGNELSMGIVLAGWLLWTALGSAALGRMADGIRKKQRLFARIQLLLSIILPLSIVAVRLSKMTWGIPVGEIVGLGEMLGISLSVLGPFCFLSGFLFALGCSLHSETTGERIRSGGVVYLLEALGAGAGGLAFTFLFVHFLSHLETAFVVAVLLILSSMSLFHQAPEKTGRRAWIWISGAILIGVFIALARGGDQLELRTRGWEWQGYHLAAAQDTPYGNLAVISTNGQSSFYENGLSMFSYPDPQTAEMSVHLAMLEHPAPKKILLIGGGISGSLAQILTHPSVSRVDYVELDPAIIDLGRRLLPEEATRSLDEARVRLIHVDGRKYIKTTDSLYDVVIVNLPDPVTARLNRFHTVDFFREVKRITKPGGIIALGLTSSENIIGPTLARRLKSLKRTMEAVYPHLLVLPGPTARFFGSTKTGLLVSDPRILVDRIKARDLELKYVRDYYLLFNLSPERQAYVRDMIASAEETKLNSDLTPSCYYYNLIHWSAQHAPCLKKIFQTSGWLGLGWFTLALIVFTAVYLIIARRKAQAVSLKSSLLLACFVTGYGEMTLTVLLILVFQSFYGYVYYKIAFLITAYMIGLVLGSWHITSIIEKINKPLRMLMMIQGGVAVYALALIQVIVWVHNSPPLSRTSVLVETGFPLLTLMAGYLGGLHFPLANSLYITDSIAVGKSAGQVYGVDLAGSSLGALSAGIVLLPILGVIDTLYFISIFNLIAMGILGISGWPKRL